MKYFSKSANFVHVTCWHNTAVYFHYTKGHNGLLGFKCVGAAYKHSGVTPTRTHTHLQASNLSYRIRMRLLRRKKRNITMKSNVTWNTPIQNCIVIHTSTYIFFLVWPLLPSHWGVYRVIVTLDHTK
jgi:hypothetical protein